jgi:hypothetical protein
VLQPIRQIPEVHCLNCCGAIASRVRGDILLCPGCGYAHELSRDLIPREPSAAALRFDGTL